MFQEATMQAEYEFDRIGDRISLTKNGIFVIVDWGPKWVACRETWEPLQNVFPHFDIACPPIELHETKVIKVPWFYDLGDFMLFVASTLHVKFDQ